MPDLLDKNTGAQASSRALSACGADYRAAPPKRRPSPAAGADGQAQPAVIHGVLHRLPPPRRVEARPRLQFPIRVGFLLNTFSFGGSETETIELVRGADPQVLRFTGIAVACPLPLPEGEPARDGSFPPIYSPASPYLDPHDSRVRIVTDFREAVSIVTQGSDVLITWGLPNLQVYLPYTALPRIVVHSKDSGVWARGFLTPNSLVTRHYVGNSTLAAHAFPDYLHPQVTVIHNGINPDRVQARLSRGEQRRLWGLGEEDRIAGYLGRIERDKGVHKIVDGVRRLGREWRAVFVGANPNSRYAGELLQLCEQAIPARYRLLPWCHDIGSALCAFDVFCHPSEHEGFSNSIGEAWLAGVPTVYTRDTGAARDVGAVGIEVSPEADGAEIAGALLTAYRNHDLARRGRQVMRAGFLAAHTVRRWTEYLVRVCDEPQRLRVLAVFPRDLAGQERKWLAALAASGLDPDLRCVVFEGGCDSAHAASHARIRRDHRSACFHAGDAKDTDKLIEYTRPDVVLVIEAPGVGRLLPPSLTIPVVILPFEPDSGSSNWMNWLRYVECARADFVFPQG